MSLGMLVRISAAFLPAMALAADSTLAIATGRDFSFYIHNGTAQAMGRNQYGQLGLGTANTGDKLVPTPVVLSGSVSEIAAGAFHTLALLTSGEVWGAGRNNDGQLGDGTLNGPNAIEWAKVELGALQVKAVAAGDSHSLFLTTDGSVYACGLNSFGQIGLGDIARTGTPSQVVFTTPNDDEVAATAIAAGPDFSYILTELGELYAAGNNAGGQLGKDSVGSSTSRFVSIRDAGVTAIAAGARHGLFIDSKEELWGTGSNNGGQLGFGDGLYEDKANFEFSGIQNVQKVAAGGEGTCISKSGEVWMRCMGSNRFGQLGLGLEPNTDKPLAVSEVQNVESMAMGESHSFFIDHDRVMVTGSNNWGELGLDTTAARSTATELFSSGSGGVRPTDKPTPEPMPAPMPVPTPSPEATTTSGNTTTTVTPNNMPEELGFNWQSFAVEMLAGSASLVIVGMCIVAGNVAETNAPKTTGDLE